MSAPCSHKDTPAPKPHIYWLGGWGLAKSDMQAIVQQALPDAEHTVFAPTASALAALVDKLIHNTKKQSASNPEHAAKNAHTHILAGYSTGAFLLLRELNKIVPALAPGQPLLLLAPFVDFRAESGLGGRIVATRLKLLLRRLRSDPLAAIADFYQQSGIALNPPTQLPYPQADLIWGIEQLAQTAVCPQTLALLQQHKNGSASQPAIRAWIGANDALLDAQKISTLFAQGLCEVAQNASHDLTSLLVAVNSDGSLQAAADSEGRLLQ